jgi:hypothetical protein
MLNFPIALRTQQQEILTVHRFAERRMLLSFLNTHQKMNRHGVNPAIFIHGMKDREKKCMLHTGGISNISLIIRKTLCAMVCQSIPNSTPVVCQMRNWYPSLLFFQSVQLSLKGR